MPPCPFPHTPLHPSICPSHPIPAAGTELGVLKWRFQSRDEDLVPITINAWPSASGSETYVNIEYESGASFDLRHVVIAIPLPHTGHPPAVNQVRVVGGGDGFV